MRFRLVLAALATFVMTASSQSAVDDPLWLEPRVTPMPQLKIGPYINLPDGRILTVDAHNAWTSDDDGQTWSDPRPLFAEGQDLAVRPERVLFRTRDGAIVLVFMNANDRRWAWDNERNAPDGDVWLHTWSIRSLDDGQSWQDAHMIQDGWCGALRDIIQTRDGHLVVTGQKLLPDLARHVVITYISTDDGASWQPSNLIDLGGRGHHDGACEATLVELADGRLWMLVRTNLDVFWDAFSDDGGFTWRTLMPGDIDASSSPGLISRLESGRLVLVWNRLQAESGEEPPRRGEPWSSTPASLFRDELSIAFSDDEGQSWSRPVVIARKPNTRLSYPWILERRPGELWITTMQGDLGLRLHEKEFVE